MLQQITVIAFDLDDTLWSCSPTIASAEKALYDFLALHYPRITECYSEAELLAKRSQFARDRTRYGAGLSAMRRAFLRFLAWEFNYPAAHLVNAGFAVFFRARQQVTFYAEVLSALERLQQNYRLGAISNGNASIKHVGLGHLIEYSVSADDLNIAKPDRRIFHKLADYFATSPAQILYVGDHPDYDVVGSRRASMHPVWMNRANQDWPLRLPRPGYQVCDLQQLEELLVDYQ